MKFTPRILWLLIAVLGLNNLVTLFGALYLIGRIDRGYSEIVEPTMPGLRDLRLLTQETSNAQRAILNLLHAADPAEYELHSKQFAGAETSSRVLLQRVFSAGLVGLDEMKEQKLRQEAEEYFTAGHRVCQLAADDRKEEAQRLRKTELREKYEAFQALQARTSAIVSDTAVRTSADLSRSVTVFRRAFFTVISLPAFALIAVGMAFGVFLVLLIRIFTRMQSDT